MQFCTHPRLKIILDYLTFLCVKVTWKLPGRAAFWMWTKGDEPHPNQERKLMLGIDHTKWYNLSLIFLCSTSELTFVYFNVFQPLLLGQKEKWQRVSFSFPLTSAQYSSRTFFFLCIFVKIHFPLLFSFLVTCFSISQSSGCCYFKMVINLCSESFCLCFDHSLWLLFQCNVVQYGMVLRTLPNSGRKYIVNT